VDVHRSSDHDPMSDDDVDMTIDLYPIDQMTVEEWYDKYGPQAHQPGDDETIKHVGDQIWRNSKGGVKSNKGNEQDEEDKDKIMGWWRWHSIAWLPRALAWIGRLLQEFVV